MAIQPQSHNDAPGALTMRQMKAIIHNMIYFMTTYSILFPVPGASMPTERLSQLVLFFGVASTLWVCFAQPSFQRTAAATVMT